jgi:glycosyltransferase involved in cell wall biosynthesis
MANIATGELDKPIARDHPARVTRPVMRVLQLIPTLGGGGAERQLSLLAAPLVDAGVELHVGFQSGGANRARLEQSGAILHPIEISSYNDPRLLLALRSLIKTVRPDVVHTWLMSMDTLGGVAARWCGVPWLMSERTAPEAYHQPRMKDRLRRYLARFATGVVGNSGHGVDIWRDTFPADRRVILPNAVAIDEISNVPPVDRAALPVPAGLPLIVYAGRLSAEKNVHVLVEALIDVVEGGHAVALLCGDGAERDALEARIRVAGLTNRIAFSGYRNDLWQILRGADCAVSLSRFEGSANIVLEAMACGCPLVLSDIPAHRADAGGAAWYVDSNDPKSIAATIRQVLSCRGDAASKAALGRQRAAERTPVRCAQTLAAAYMRASKTN